MPMDFAEKYGPWGIVLGGSDGIGAAFATRDPISSSAVAAESVAIASWWARSSGTVSTSTS